MLLGPLIGFVLKPFNSYPFVGAIGFGWGVAALCDHLASRKARQLGRPPQKSVSQQDYDSIYGTPQIIRPTT